MRRDRKILKALGAVTLIVGLTVAVVPAQIQISGPIYDGSGGPLVSGNTYKVNGDISVPAGQTLTVQGGAVIKLQGGQVFVDGTLNVAASSATPAIFTCWNDGSVGAPVGTGAPSPGQWNRIQFGPTSDGSVLVGAEVRYAGAWSIGSITLDQADITLTDCTVAFGHASGLAGANNSFPSVSGCAFSNCGGYAVIEFSVDALPGFSGNFASGNGSGNCIRVTAGTVSGNLAFGPQCGMNGDGVVVFQTDLGIPAGQTLTLAAGTIIKWVGNYHLVVDGTLHSQGSATDPVILTSIHDDSAGGDTNVNGNATAPSPGHWNRVQFNPSSDASTLAHTEVRYAGAWSTGAITLDQADITLTDCTVAFGHTSGLSGTINSLPTVSGCTFSNCAGYAVTEFSVGALPGFSGNFASGNGNGNFIRVTAGTVSGNLAFGPQCGMNGDGVVVFQVDLGIPAGQTLTLAAGTIIKWAFSYHLIVDGTLHSQGSATDPVILTSFHDDSAGGDTNLNGSATGPSPGQWNRVQFGPSSDASTLAHTEVRYAGAWSTGAVTLDQADVTLTSCKISHSHTAGLHGGASSHPTVAYCAFENCTSHAATEFSLDAVPGFSDNTATGNGDDDLRITSGAFTGWHTIGSRAGMNGSGVLVVSTDLSVPSGQTLDVLPGTIIKWEGNHSFNVLGTLSIFGTGFDPVVMTSIHDDAFGGDTNANGTATVPGAGQWNRVEYQPGSTGLVRNLRLRYGGAWSTAVFTCASPLVAVRALHVEYSHTKGMVLSALDGDALDCVAFACSNVGAHLAAGSMGFIHGTVAGNGGIGILSDASHNGVAVNTISWGNGGANYSGFAPMQLAYCDGSSAAAGSNGNIHADPLFADPVNGDLTLLSGSPALNAGNVAVGTALVTDCSDASRLLDHDLSGNDAPDMGAFELAVWTMTVTGEPRLGTTISFDTVGPTGTAIYAMGFLDGPEILLSPLGFLTLGDPANYVLIGLWPTNSPLSFQLPPPNPVWQGAPFAIQALVLPNPGATVGNITQRYANLLFY